MPRNDGKRKSRGRSAKEFIAAHKKARSVKELVRLLNSTPSAVAVRACKLRNEGYKIPTFKEKEKKASRVRK